MAITVDQLVKIMPYAKSRAALFVDPLNAAMRRFGINTLARETAFIAQIAHESGELRYVKELASGAAYEGRADLGNTEPGDGARYKGRGLIQITGRDNYDKCGEALGINLLDDSELLERPDWAAMSAAWFWATHGCNTLADSGFFERITRRINGGTNGADSRLAYFRIATQEMGSANA